MQNGTPYKLQETVPDYFSGAVLQRHHLNEPGSGIVTLKFQVAFNLAVVWMIVFVSLSKGTYPNILRKLFIFTYNVNELKKFWLFIYSRFKIVR